jgi:hypothetical protein
MTGYEACLILHGKKSGFFSKVALNDSTKLNFMAVFLCMRIPENCKHYGVIYGPENHILRHVAVKFLFFFLSKPSYVASTVSGRGRVFYAYARGIYGNLLESERGGSGDTSIGTDRIPLCGEWGDTFPQAEQSGTVQAFRD